LEAFAARVNEVAGRFGICLSEAFAAALEAVTAFTAAAEQMLAFPDLQEKDDFGRKR
jgi:hypothetical protein